MKDDAVGLFALVDTRVPDDDLARLAVHLDRGIGLNPTRWPPQRDPLPLTVGDNADHVREAIAHHVTEQTRAHLAEARQPKLAVLDRTTGSDGLNETLAASSGDDDGSATTTPAAHDGSTPEAAGDAERNAKLDLLGDRPHSARAYDYALGGKTHYYADRLLYEELVKVFPTVRVAAVNNRAFMHRAVRYLAEQGIDQFLDIGTGIPTEPNLHQIVQAVNPAARVVYIDNDPIVLAHAAALMVSTPEGRTTYVEADARDPDAILGSEQLRHTLDLTRPVAISNLALLHFLDDGAAENLVRTLLAAVPVGSAFVLSHATFDTDDNGVLRRAVTAYQASNIGMWPRTADHLTNVFLADLDVVEPGVISIHRWRPDAETPGDAVDSELMMYGAVARLWRSRSDQSGHTAAPSAAFDTAAPSAALDTAAPSAALDTAAPSAALCGEDTAKRIQSNLRTDRPHSARMYDYFLGGKTNFEADRAAAAVITDGFPTVGLTARSQRAFMHRAAGYIAREGIDQFLDIGTGIPTEPNLHQIVQAVNPAARVVYVDNDPIVLAHAAALMSSDDRGSVTYLDADARDPDAILASDAVQTTLDLTRPVGISILGLLHFLDDTDAYRLVHTLLDSVPPGSILALSQGTADAGGSAVHDKGGASWKTVGLPVSYRTKDQVQTMFLDGLVVVEPGITFTHRWRPDSHPRLQPSIPDADISIYAVVARKP